eukprot:TRINITY_DN7026_c0_g1_i3.p1 TRINITY_DN7026_c0_g1~~TRINITY_DN7026_c0_g1_i3.p1  ORF type:complete len:291 (+),score=18.88 TRINITY_DN7026_c0_g1_i3:641-1513(+)
MQAQSSNRSQETDRNDNRNDDGFDYHRLEDEENNRDSSSQRLVSAAPIAQESRLRSDEIGSHVKVDRQPTVLHVTIPPLGLRGQSWGLTFFALLGCGIIFTIASSVDSDVDGNPIPVLIRITFFLAGGWMIWLGLKGLGMETQLRMDETDYNVEWWLFLTMIQRRAGRTDNIQGVHLSTVESQHVDHGKGAGGSRYPRPHTGISDTPTTWLEIADAGPHCLRSVVRVVSDATLSIVELHGLAEVMSGFIAELPSVEGKYQPAPIASLGKQFELGAKRAAIPDNWVATSKV